MPLITRIAALGSSARKKTQASTTASCVTQIAASGYQNDLVSCASSGLFCVSAVHRWLTIRNSPCSAPHITKVKPVLCLCFLCCFVVFFLLLWCCLLCWFL